MFRLLFLKALPKNLTSRFVGWLANRRISHWAIRPFASFYDINLAEAEKEPAAYRTLNAFFTRRLKPGVRPIADENNPSVVVSPVDGVISEWGDIVDGRLIQAKGKYFSLESFLGSKEEAEPFRGGIFITIYLAPVDYHRIHYPVSGAVTGYRKIPGTLYPVNPFSVARVPNLFAINERIVTHLRAEKGKVGLVKVGATIVGKIKVTYADIQSNTREGEKVDRFAQPIPMKKGDEVGLFEMGSTVVLLFERGLFSPESLSRGQKIRLGEKIGTLLPS